MMKETRWLLFTTAALLVLVAQTAAVAPFKKVSIATTTASTTTTTTASTPSTEAPTAEGEEKHDNATITAKNSKLTGIPQIDWVWDPNLPRELRGYNLSQYPFFSTVPPPEDIHFKCDNLHDGFYASIEFKCQVYHHCVYGIRHDFLCANFTAFDQKTFICHFVSDVDCEGSMKYWNRNDNLYMATTTTTTSTTTTEPPPTPRRRPIQRPLRPLRRPVNRRPAADDYYYDEEEYDDDYYEERLNRRRKQRPRQRKPIVEYEDDYEEKRSFAADEEEKPRKSSSRDRYREEEEVENDYDSFPEKRPKQERSKPTSKTTSTAPERRKIGSRKPGTILARPKADERRSFSDDRPYPAGKEKSKPVPQPAVEDSEEPVDAPPPRRLVGRRRINEKRTSPLPSTAAALDDIDEDHLVDEQQDELAEEGEHTEAKPTTPKPLEEFVTPKAPSPVYARPRAPPRIARPVPVNAKKKFQYPVVKANGGTTAAPAAAAADEDYYEDDYADSRVAGGHPRRRIADAEDDDLPPVSRRRQHKDAAPVAPRKPTRSGLRKPVTDKKPLPPVEDDEYADGVSAERYDSRNAPPPPAARKRPYAAGRNRAKQRGNAADDVDFVDDDYEERPVQRPATRSRPKAGAGRKAGTIAKKNTRPPPVLDVDEDVEEEVYEAERPSRQRPTASSQRNRKKQANGRLRQPAPTVATPAHSDETVDSDAVEEDDEDAHVPAAPSKTSGRSPSVRVVKRPFLPSRGGSPYLPRGLQPVGIAKSKSSSFNAHTTDSTPLDMGSTISGVRLLEHGAPILRDSGVSEQLNPLGLRTTLPPRSAIPVSPTLPEPPTKVNLDELYENDYDVTLNDALDPTLKPLSPHHQLQHQNQHQQHDQHDNHEHSINYASAYSSAPAANTAYSSNLNSAASAPSASLVVVGGGGNGGENAQQQHPSQLQQQSQQQQRFSHSPNAYLSSKPHQTLSHSPSLSSSSSSSQQSQSPQAYLNPAYQQALLKQQQQYAQQQQSSNHQQQHQIQQHQQQQQQQQQHHHALNNYNSDSYFSSTDIRRRAIVAPSAARTSRTDYRGGGAGGGGSDTAINTRIAQHFYDDFDY